MLCRYYEKKWYTSVWWQEPHTNRKIKSKRSIPGHPTFVNDVHHDLHLSYVTSKIKRIHPLIMVNMSAKFDEDAHNGLVAILFTKVCLYMSIVTFTFDLWPSKSIGFILSLCFTCLPSPMKKHTKVLSVSCSQAYFHTCNHACRHKHTRIYSGIIMSDFTWN